MVRVELDITKSSIFLFAIALVLVVVAVVYAYGGTDPSIHGHSSGEIEGGGSGILECQSVDKTCYANFCSVECPSGYIATGGGFGNDEIDSSYVDWDMPLNQRSGMSDKEGWYVYAYQSNPTYVYAICCKVS